MTSQDFLAKLGLSSKQIQVYLDLASHPESTIVALHKRLGIPRSSLYLETERLVNKGFVISKHVGKSTLYKITDPSILKLTLESESAKLNYLTSHLSSFASMMTNLKTTKEPQKMINIYKGQSGIKQLLWNIITSDAKLVIGYSPGQLEAVTDREFAEKWRDEFRKRGKHNKIIFNQPKPLAWSDVPHFLTENVDVKTLDEKQIKFDRLTLIYDDVFTVCSLKADGDQYGIEIRDQLLINSYKQIFEFLWDHVAKNQSKQTSNR
ncbi:MAG: helix-turn-helix domain-containing protein [Microgenomates group bacterium]